MRAAGADRDAHLPLAGSSPAGAVQRRRPLVPHGERFFTQVHHASADPEQFAALAPICPVFRLASMGAVVSPAGVPDGARKGAASLWPFR